MVMALGGRDGAVEPSRHLSQGPSEQYIEATTIIVALFSQTLK